MKLITAIIREAQLDMVRDALIDSGITRITVSYVSGHGQQHSFEVHRGQKIAPSLIPKIKFEVAVNEEFVDTTIDTIIAAARTKIDDVEGEVGDGKIFITNLEECVRIRTNERGTSAI